MRTLILFSDALTLPEKISISATTMLLGMLTIFAVLTLIMIVLTVIGKFFEKKEKGINKKETASPALSNVTSSEPAVTESVQETASDDTAIVAAITAAIAVYTEQPISSFRVVSFRKTSTKTAWNKK